MATLAQTQKKVQNILTSKFGSVRVDSDNEFVFPYESTLVTIKVEEFGGKSNETVIDITAIVSRDTPASTKLYKWLNEKNANIKFGSVYHLESGSKSLILLQYSILGDFVDPEELINGVMAVVLIADIIDDEVVDEFGGKRFID